MSYDDIINANQGSVKLSETFGDREINVIETAEGESGIKVVERLRDLGADAVRKNSFLLHSTGRIKWTGTEIEWEDDFGAGSWSNIVLTLFQHENPGVRTVNLVMTGNSSFTTMALADNEMLYIEIDRANIASTAISDIAIDSGTTGARLVKATLEAGMPEMKTTDGSTAYIPLVARLGDDIWWIPHGIRWIPGTQSTLGAVIVDGQELYPSYFVDDEGQLHSATLGLTGKGGLICLNLSFPVTDEITIPDGVTLTGRTSSIAATAPSVITLTQNGRIVMNNSAAMKDLAVIGDASFGSFASSVAVTVGDYCTLTNCSFQFLNDVVTYTKTAVSCIGTRSKLSNCRFYDLSGDADKVGINYAGTFNTDIDSLFIG
jgi:hypothetical protein